MIISPKYEDLQYNAILLNHPSHKITNCIPTRSVQTDLLQNYTKTDLQQQYTIHKSFPIKTCTRSEPGCNKKTKSRTCQNNEVTCQMKLVRILANQTKVRTRMLNMKQWTTCQKGTYKLECITCDIKTCLWYAHISCNSMFNRKSIKAGFWKHTYHNNQQVWH